MAGQRRLAAILMADMVGYSRLVESDETGTIERQSRHRAELIDPEIAAKNGRIVKTTGDGILVEFASVVEAVECAVAIQRAMVEREADIPKNRRIIYRVGINLGDIVIEGDDILGDGVNIAARLEELAVPGGINISGTAYDHLKRKVDVGYEFLGALQVKNIVEPVRAYRVLIEPGAAATHIRKGSAWARYRWTALTAAAVLSGFLLAGGTIWWITHGQPESYPVSAENVAYALPDKPSIAVLPFANMSDDPGQEYFADGMTEDLITDLSKVSALFVAARNSTFAYKGKNVDVRQISKELGVRYVLEGSVRRAGGRIRINAQLIDTATGGHLWADRYDGALTDVFALQDTVSSQIVAALEVSLTDEEVMQRTYKYTDNADAYDAFLKGWAYYQHFSANDFVMAVPYFERAVALDPEYGRAHAALASLYWESVRQGDSWTSKVTPDPANFVAFNKSRSRAAEHLELAMRNPSPLAYRVASAMSWDYRQFDDAIAQAAKAVSLDPNDPDGYVALAWAMIFDGRPQAALTSVQQAMRLDPRNPETYSYVLGMALFGLEKYEGAVDALERAHERNPEYLDPNVPLAVVNVYLGRDEKARAALSRYTDAGRLSVAGNVDGIMSWWPFKREADIRRFGEALTRAGLCCEALLEQYVEHLRQGGTLE